MKGANSCNAAVSSAVAQRERQPDKGPKSRFNPWPRNFSCGDEMADELIDGMTVEEFEAWYLRIFGSVEAYTASLPSRNWVRGSNGWVSYPND